MKRLGALLFSDLAPGNKPDDNPDYQTPTLARDTTNRARYLFEAHRSRCKNVLNKNGTFG